MILLEGTLLRPLAIEQVNLKIYLPSNKIYLSQTTERDFSSPAKYSHWLFFVILGTVQEKYQMIISKGKQSMISFWSFLTTQEFTL